MQPKNRFDNVQTLYNTEDKVQYKGLYLKINQLKNLQMQSYTIPLKYHMRPDLICYDLYGDHRFAYILAYINNITDTPKGFTSALQIYVPVKSELV